jgi:hypothetical protein
VDPHKYLLSIGPVGLRAKLTRSQAGEHRRLPRCRAAGLRLPTVAEYRVAWRLSHKPHTDPVRRSVMGRPMLRVAEDGPQVGREPRQSDESRYVSHQLGSKAFRTPLCNSLHAKHKRSIGALPIGEWDHEAPLLRRMLDHRLPDGARAHAVSTYVTTTAGRSGRARGLDKRARRPICEDTRNAVRARVRLCPTACPTRREFPMVKPDQSGIIIRVSGVGWSCYPSAMYRGCGRDYGAE